MSPAKAAAPDPESGLASGGLILFNALSLYEVLTPTESLEPVRKLRASRGTWKLAIEEAFTTALKKNYDAVFVYGKSVLEELPSAPFVEAALESLLSVAESIAGHATLLRNDMSARLYHSTLGSSVAKAYATFYTRIPASELLAWISVEGYRDRVADFACGSGTLLVAAYH